MTSRISHAIDVFLKAIENGTLAKGRCKACAVGNLVANALGIEIKELNHNYLIEWGFWYPYLECAIPSKQDLLGKKEIEATGFSVDEIRQIEAAFEENTRISYLDYAKYSKEQIRQDQINGLEAVIEVMMEFDDVKGCIQELFTNRAKQIAI